METRGNDSNFGMGKLVRAMAGVETDIEGIKYLRDMSSATGAVVIPQKLAVQILDMARTESAVFGKIPVTEQLLDSANISDVLMNACSKAIATALDKALLYGTGTGTEIKGISAHTNINKVSHTGNVDYSMLIKGIGATKTANIIPPIDLVYKTTVGTDLAMLTDVNGQYIVPPKVLDNYAISESNNINDNQALVYNRDCMLLGVNQSIKMEWGYSSDGFQRRMYFL